MEGKIRAISRHMEGQESSGSDTHQGKLQKYLDLCTHPNVRGFKGNIREKGIKSRVQQIIDVFRDDLGNIKGTIMVHGVQRVYRGTGKAIKV